MKIKNGKRQAVALKYVPALDNAPRVVAKGKGKIAEKIIKIARDHNIYIQNDPDLVEILSHLNISEQIPPELYVVVAELLAFVYSLNAAEKYR